uniref:50S ribosomal protein L40e n=1 Tax=uncultured korarchaeote TaxID=161241 RepID=A0A1L2JPT7_9CREN|nr:ribosomal protein L40E [uncultured korarchaeote]
MPIEDPFKRQIAVRALLRYKICRECGAHNFYGATKCRRCKSKNLRPKHEKPKSR